MSSMLELLDRRPLLIALAGQDGAGKTTLYRTYLKPSGLRFVNADEIAKELGADAYVAAKMADALRRELVARRESFIFETVFSDPVGDKIAFSRKRRRADIALRCFL